MGKVNLQELLDGKEPVYVLNRTGKLRGGKTSTFILTVRMAHGAKALPIPATKWPVDISALVPRTALRDCDDLFHACRPGGPLEVISPEAGRAMLTDPIAQKSVDAALAKLERAGAKPNTFKLETKQANAGSQSTQVPPNMRGGDPEMSVTAPKLVVAQNEVSPRIKQAMAGLANHPDTVEDVWAQLAGIPDEELGVEDLGFIIKNAHPHVRIVKWAKLELAKRSTPDDEVEDMDNVVPDEDLDDAPMAPRRVKRHPRH
jgi:hypothetical protein